MTSANPYYSEWMTLISARLDDRETAESSARLDAYLLESSEACCLYLDLADLHATLGWEANARQPQLDLPKDTIAPPLSPVPGFLGRTTALRNWPVYWSVLAAGVLFAAYFVIVSWNMLGKKSSQPPRGYPADSGQQVAVISDSQDASWSRATDKSEIRTSKSEIGSAVRPGEPLAITSGLVELQLKRGTTLIVEGPAEWSIDGENRATLKRGKLIAKVPQQAIGFTLFTPSSRVVDLGTVFEVIVGREGDSEVRVLKGAATAARLISPGGHAGYAQPIRLTAGEGLRVAATGEAPILLSMDSSGNFQPQLPAANNRPHDPADETAPTEPGQLAGLTLWLRADRGAIADANGGVKRWEDQSGNKFDAIQPEHARQPQLLTSGNDVHSIRFDGEDDYLDCVQTIDVGADRDFTLFIVCKLLDEKPQSGIFSFRDQEFGDWNSFGGLAFCRGVAGKGLRVVQAEFKHNIGGAGVTEEHDVLGFETGSGYAPPDATFVASLTKSDGTAILWANGLRVDTDRYAIRPADSSALRSAAGYVLAARAVDESSIHPGTTGFGRIEIAEILVYKRALDAREFKQVNHYLSAKYLHPPLRVSP